MRAIGLRDLVDERVTCCAPHRRAGEWLDEDIEATIHYFGAQPFLETTTRAQPVWPTPERTITTRPAHDVSV